MRVFFIGTIIVVVLSTIAVRIRREEPAASNVLFGFAALTSAMLVAAFYEWV